MTITTEALVKKFEQAYKSKAGYIWGQSGDIWTAAKQKALIKSMISTYGTDWINNEKAKKNNYYQGARYGEKWIGHQVFDCSGLFPWAFRQLGGGSIAHGSNSIWDSYCSEKGKLINGKRTDGKELQPGTAVFTEAKNGQHNHIGLYIGNGDVIEAQGTKAGVVISKVALTKWAAWGELKGVKYAMSTAGGGNTESDEKQHATLRKGDKGAAVQQMQTRLISLGYDCGSYGADGDFGSQTEKAVKTFQEDHGLTADGICGPKTWSALDAAPPEPAPAERYTVTIPGLTRDEAEKICREWSAATMKKE